MPSREKTVALSIAGAIGAWIVWSVFSSMFFTPIADLEMKIGVSEASKTTLEKQDLETTLASRALTSAERLALPPDRSEAQRLYEKWLRDLTAACGMKIDAKLTSPRSEGDFWAIPVSFTATATYEQANAFLRRFSEVNLLHRLSSFQVTASDPPGNPRMQLQVTAEGFSMPRAKARTSILPTTSLAAELPEAGKELTVAGQADFPAKAPFTIRIGNEWLTVSAVQEKRWTVERAAEGSTASPHAAGELVELWPIKPIPQGQVAAADAAQKLLAFNMFAKPRPKIEYNPRLTPSGTQHIVRGTPLAITVKTESWDPAYGTPVFEFEGETPPGLTIDPKSGKLTWDPPKSVDPGEYKIKIVAVAEEVNKRIPTDLILKLRNPNRPPVFARTETPVAFLGRPVVVEVSATDPDPKDRLTYSLTGSSLPGAAINASTGQFTWTPPEDMDVGEVRTEVTVTDNGDPPQSAKRTLAIRTAEDAARFTRLTTIFGVNGERQARFYDSSLGKVTAKRVNESFKFADVEGTVLAIDNDRIVVETGGKQMQLELGMAVRDMKPASPAVVPVKPVGESSPTNPAAAPVEGDSSSAPAPAAAPMTANKTP